MAPVFAQLLEKFAGTRFVLLRRWLVDQTTQRQTAGADKIIVGEIRTTPEQRGNAFDENNSLRRVQWMGSRHDSL